MSFMVFSMKEWPVRDLTGFPPCFAISFSRIFELFMSKTMFAPGVYFRRSLAIGIRMTSEL